MTAAEDAAVLEGRLGAIGRELGVKPSSCSPAVAGEAPATPTVAAADSTPPPPTAAAAAPRIGMTDSPLPQCAAAVLPPHRCSADCGHFCRWARLTISGGLAGLVTKTATAPLDRIKVLQHCLYLVFPLPSRLRQCLSLRSSGASAGSSHVWR